MPERAYFAPELETMPQEELKALQLERLKKVLSRAHERSPFYRKLWGQAGLKPKNLRHLEDLKSFPFLDKGSILEAYPWGPVLAEREELLEMHSTSGTTGRPVLVFATKGDLDLWAELNARSLWMVGLRPGDSLLNAYGFGLPTGGFGFHYGAQRLGALAIPTSSGQPERQVDLLLDLKVTAFCMTPSFALYCGQRAIARGINLASEAACTIGIFGAEPWPRATRLRIEEIFGITAYDEFGMTEFLGPGMACECKERDPRFGMHAWADAFLVECVDPESGDPLPDGEEGELVWTSLALEGTAMVRYRSHDLSALTWEPCPCGRTHPRISAIKGRTDDAVTIGGFIVFPSQVEEALSSFPETGANFRMVITRDERELDFFILRIEVKDGAVMENKDRCLWLEGEMKSAVKRVTGVTPKLVEFFPPDSLPRVLGGEAKTASARVEDQRRHWKQ